MSLWSWLFPSKKKKPLPLIPLRAIPPMRDVQPLKVSRHHVIDVPSAGEFEAIEDGYKDQG